ncbi:hypothetical protein G6F46_013230 [Rhizopus delemar]|nr:hypothetical protein G6F46_013230 [Rhizopus delemar]
MAEFRAFAFDEVQLQAHRIGNGEDVREQDGRVQREAAQRLQGDFAGDLRGLGHGQEAAGLGPGRTVFRQVAAGLAHQPDGGAVHRFAAQGAQQAIVAERAGHDGHSLGESWQRRQSPRGVLHRPAGSARAEAASGHRRDRSRAAVPNRRTGPAAGSGAGSAAPAHRHRDVAEGAPRAAPHPPQRANAPRRIRVGQQQRQRFRRDHQHVRLALARQALVARTGVAGA